MGACCSLLSAGVVPGAVAAAIQRSALRPAVEDHGLAWLARQLAYAQAYLAASSRRSAEQAIARVGNRIRIRDQRLPEIEAWLARQAAP